MAENVPTIQAISSTPHYHTTEGNSDDGRKRNWSLYACIYRRRPRKQTKISDVRSQNFPVVFPGHRKLVDTDVRVSVDSCWWALSNGVCYAIVGQITAELCAAKLSPYKLNTCTVLVKLLAIALNHFVRFKRQNKAHSMSYLAQLVPRVYLKPKLR